MKVKKLLKNIQATTVTLFVADEVEDFNETFSPGAISNFNLEKWWPHGEAEIYAMWVEDNTLIVRATEDLN